MKQLVLGAVLAVTTGFGGALGQGFPSRSVTIVVPFAAGGPTDTVARIIAQGMGPALGQSVVIENTAGAAGTIGVGRVARAAPDGYTIVLGHWSTFVVNPAVYRLQYDVASDFEPIALIADNPLLIVSKKDVPARTLDELTAWVKTNQDHITEGTSGIGSAAHIAGLYYQKLTGTKFQFVPYRGAGPVMQDLLAGQIDLTIDQSANSLPQVRSGQIKAYAVTAKTRIASAPDIPTVDEAGLPDFYISVWFGLWAPKGTPQDVIARLAGAVQSGLANPAMQHRLAELGVDLPAREEQTPEGLRAYHKAELTKWTPLIKAANIKVE
jgi:tripartite-type tricarboxylate transporter receptor subunit TctC